MSEKNLSMISANHLLTDYKVDEGYFLNDEERETWGWSEDKEVWVLEVSSLTPVKTDLVITFHAKDYNGFPYKLSISEKK